MEFFRSLLSLTSFVSSPLMFRHTELCPLVGAPVNNSASLSTVMKFVVSVGSFDVIKRSVSLLPKVDTKVGCLSLRTFKTSEELCNAFTRVLPCSFVDLSPHLECLALISSTSSSSRLCLLETDAASSIRPIKFCNFGVLVGDM